MVAVRMGRPDEVTEADVAAVEAAFRTTPTHRVCRVIGGLPKVAMRPGWPWRTVLPGQWAVLALPGSPAPGEGPRDWVVPDDVFSATFMPVDQEDDRG